MTKTLFEEALREIPESVKLLVEYQHVISERLEKELEARPMSQREFATLAGKDESVISEVLAASKNLTLRTIAELSYALKMDLLGLVHKTRIQQEFSTSTTVAADNMQHIKLEKDHAGIPVGVSIVTEYQTNARVFA